MEITWASFLLAQRCPSRELRQTYLDKSLVDDFGNVQVVISIHAGEISFRFFECINDSYFLQCVHKRQWGLDLEPWQFDLNVENYRLSAQLTSMRFDAVDRFFAHFCASWIWCWTSSPLISLNILANPYSRFFGKNTYIKISLSLYGNPRTWTISFSKYGKGFLIFIIGT